MEIIVQSQGEDCCSLLGNSPKGKGRRKSVVRNTFGVKLCRHGGRAPLLTHVQRVKASVCFLSSPISATAADQGRNTPVRVAL